MHARRACARKQVERSRPARVILVVRPGEQFTMDKPFQRRGAKSNTAVGRAFESRARDFFSSLGLELERDAAVEIGVNGKKLHSFDLGCAKRKVLVECKSHTWTAGNNVPSAKLTTWDQAMYFFFAAPSGYRKIFFVRRDYCPRRKQTLAEYYIRTHSHLIPGDVEFWEYDEAKHTAKKIQ